MLDTPLEGAPAEATRRLDWMMAPAVYFFSVID
jgi:hypothetical protein